MARVAEQAIEVLVVRAVLHEVLDLLQEEHCLQRTFHARIGLAQFTHRNERNDTDGDDGQQGKQQRTATLGKGRRACELAVIVALMLQPATRGSRTPRLATSSEVTQRKPHQSAAINRTRLPATPRATRPCFSASASSPNTSRRQP